MGLFSRKDKAQGAPEIPTLEDQLAAIFEEWVQDLSDPTLFGERDDSFEANMMPVFEEAVFKGLTTFRSTIAFQDFSKNHPYEFRRDPVAPFKRVKEAAEAWGYDYESVISHTKRAAIQQMLAMKPVSPGIYEVTSSDHFDEAESFLRDTIMKILPERVITMAGLTNRAKVYGDVIREARHHLILSHRKMLVNRGDREAAITWLRTEMDDPRAALKSLIGPHNLGRRMELYGAQIARIEREYKHEQAQAHFNRAAKENPASTREADLAAGRIVEIEHDDKTPIDLTGYFKSIIGQNKRYSISSKSEGRFCVISVDEEQKQAWIVAMNDADGKWLGRFRVDVGHAISHNHVFNQIAAKCGTLTVLDDLFTDLFKPLNGMFK